MYGIPPWLSKLQIQWFFWFSILLIHLIVDCTILELISITLRMKTLSHNQTFISHRHQIRISKWKQLAFIHETDWSQWERDNTLYCVYQYCQVQVTIQTQFHPQLCSSYEIGVAQYKEVDPEILEQWVVNITYIEEVTESFLGVHKPCIKNDHIPMSKKIEDVSDIYVQWVRMGTERATEWFNSELHLWCIQILHDWPHADGEIGEGVGTRKHHHHWLWAWKVLWNNVDKPRKSCIQDLQNQLHQWWGISAEWAGNSGFITFEEVLV